MTEAQSLFALVLFIYALECFVVVRPGDAVAVSIGGRAHRLFTHDRSLKVLQYGVAPAPPLPFLGGVYRLATAAGASALAESAFDERAAAARLANARRRAIPLRVIGGLMFVTVFVLIPISAFSAKGFVPLRWAFAALALLHVAALVLSWLAMRRLDPNARGERRELLLKSLLSPLLSMRLGLIVPTRALEGFDPLVGVKLLCPPADFETFVRRQESAGRAAEPMSRQVAARTSFLERAGLTAARLRQPPPRRDPSCRSYCPRCLAQYARVNGSCNDCGHETLAALAD